MKRGAWRLTPFRRYTPPHLRRLPRATARRGLTELQELAHEFGVTLYLDVKSSDNGKGRGLFYTSRLSGMHDEELPTPYVIRVPTDLCIFCSLPPLNKPHPLSDAVSLIPDSLPWEIKVGALLLWILKSDGHSLVSRFWSRYISFLPSPSELTSLLMYNEEELALFGDEKLTVMAKDWQKEVDDSFDSLRSMGGLLSGLEADLNDFKWAVSVVESRAFGFKVKGEVLQALVPFFDQANHSFDSEASHDLEVDADRVVMKDDSKALCSRKEFEISYGAKSNLQLQLQYGFIIPGNPFDTIKDLLTMRMEKLPPIRRELASNAAEHIIQSDASLSILDAQRLRTMAKSINRTAGWRSRREHEAITKEREQESILKLSSLAALDLISCLKPHPSSVIATRVNKAREVSALKYREERRRCLEALGTLARTMLSGSGNSQHI